MSILDNMFGNEDSMEKAMREMGETFFHLEVLGTKEIECTQLLQRAQKALVISGENGKCEKIDNSKTIESAQMSSPAALIINGHVYKNGYDLGVEDIIERLKMKKII